MMRTKLLYTFLFLGCVVVNVNAKKRGAARTSGALGAFISGVPSLNDWLQQRKQTTVVGMELVPLAQTAAPTSAQQKTINSPRFIAVDGARPLKLTKMYTGTIFEMYFDDDPNTVRQFHLVGIAVPDPDSQLSLERRVGRMVRFFVKEFLKFKVHQEGRSDYLKRQ